jgi:hypothetical protein
MILDVRWLVMRLKITVNRMIACLSCLRKDWVVINNTSRKIAGSSFDFFGRESLNCL